MKHLLLALALSALVASAEARGEEGGQCRLADTALVTGWILGGAGALAFGAYDIAAIVRGERPDRTVAIAEIVAMSGSATIILAGTFCGDNPDRVELGIGTAAIALPFIVHGIWALATDRPLETRGTVIGPTMVGRAPGIGVVGRF